MQKPSPGCCGGTWRICGKSLLERYLHIFLGEFVSLCCPCHGEFGVRLSVDGHGWRRRAGRCEGVTATGSHGAVGRDLHAAFAQGLGCVWMVPGCSPLPPMFCPLSSPELWSCSSHGGLAVGPAGTGALRKGRKSATTPRPGLEEAEGWQPTFVGLTPGERAATVADPTLTLGA